ncbi:PhnD/SsuA/transferrin family substrate-binding protein [Malaciobacter mytili]|uniref:PhnD/SsuA/transferrin family substrate-binding protein n=1 Tax=Malaciobacter mytili TaxID=603050 RepID=UPI003A87BD1A
MKKLIILCILILCLNAKEYRHISTFGFLSNGTSLQNFKDGQIAFSLWIEELASLYDSKLDVEYYTDKNDILHEFTTKNFLDMIVIPVPFYFENKKQIDEISDDFWSVSINDKKYIKYILIARKKLNAKSFKDLKDKKIILNEENNISETWLDKQSIIYNNKRYKDVVREAFYEKKESTILLRVFFGKSDFGVISENVWDTMLELNPAIKNRVDIVASSKKEHFPFIGFFKKESNKDIREIFFNITSDLKQFPKSEQIIDLLKFDTVFKIEKDSLQNLEKFYNEYYDLRKRVDNVNSF